MKDFLALGGAWLYAVLTHKIVLLSVGGALGTNARYWIARALDQATWIRGFPVGTFAINVSGSFVLGVAAVWILERMPPEYQHWYLLVGTGFCGGYTTFSTFEWETFRLLRDGAVWMAVANVAGSVAAGFLGVAAGVALATLVLPKP